MAELFDFTLPFHSYPSGFVLFNVRQLLGFVGFGVSCAFTRLVLLCAGFNVFGEACVEASVITKQNVNVKRHA